MYDNTHAQEPIFEEGTVNLDQDDEWVDKIYCRHLKPKESEETLSPKLARELIEIEIKNRCTKLAHFYECNKLPAKPFSERVHMVIEALEMPSFIGYS